MAAASEANIRRDEAVAKLQTPDGGGDGKWKGGGPSEVSRAPAGPATHHYGSNVQRIVHPPPHKPFKEMTAEEYAYDYLASRGFGGALK
jgi:hypothetical protein